MEEHSNPTAVRSELELEASMGGRWIKQAVMPYFSVINGGGGNSWQHRASLGMYRENICRQRSHTPR
jgi:hypothetical protein